MVVMGGGMMISGGSSSSGSEGSTNYHQLDKLIVRVVDTKYSSKIAEIISRMLKRRHNDVVDFEIIVPEQLLKQEQQTKRIFSIVLSSIASISLIVGGIGIMNIMYVTVTERTREIGLRMAVGARNNDILKQFLFESSIMSLAGGMIGMAFGVGLSYIASYFLGWPFVLNLITMGISFFVCAAIGIFFGWYPARKASNLDPINALRYE